MSTAPNEVPFRKIDLLDYSYVKICQQLRGTLKTAF